MSDLNRRSFVRTAAGLAAAPSLASLCAACGSTTPAADTPSSTSVSTDSSNVLALTFADHPELKDAGGSVRLSVKKANGSTQLVSVTRVDSSNVKTVSAICTHAGCTVGAYSASSGHYSCPCHGSVFDSSGAVVTSPATSPLTAFTSTLSSTGVSVSFS